MIAASVSPSMSLRLLSLLSVKITRRERFRLHLLGARPARTAARTGLDFLGALVIGAFVAADRRRQDVHRDALVGAIAALDAIALVAFVAGPILA